MRGLSKYFSYCFSEDEQEHEYQIQLGKSKESNLTKDQIDSILEYVIPMSTIFFDRERQIEVKDFLDYHFSKYTEDPEDFFDAVEFLYVCGGRVSKYSAQELKSNCSNGLKWIEKKREELKNKPHFITVEDNLPPLYKFVSSKEEAHPYDIVLKNQKEREDGSSELIIPDNYVLCKNFLGKLYGSKNPAFNHHACLEYHYSHCDEKLKPIFLEWTENMWLDTLKSDEKNRLIQKINKKIEDWFNSKWEEVELEKQKIPIVRKFFPNLPSLKNENPVYSELAKEFYAVAINTSLYDIEEMKEYWLEHNYKETPEKEGFLRCIEDLMKIGYNKFNGTDFYKSFYSIEFINNSKEKLNSLKNTVPKVIFNWIEEKRNELSYEHNNSRTDKFLKTLKDVELVKRIEGNNIITYVKDAYTDLTKNDEILVPIYHGFIEEIKYHNQQFQRGVLAELISLHDDLKKAQILILEYSKKFDNIAVSMTESNCPMIRFIGFDKHLGIGKDKIWDLHSVWLSKSIYAWKAIEHLSTILGEPTPQINNQSQVEINVEADKITLLDFFRRNESREQHFREILEDNEITINGKWNSKYPLKFIRGMILYLESRPDNISKKEVRGTDLYRLLVKEFDFKKSKNEDQGGRNFRKSQFVDNEITEEIKEIFSRLT